MLYEGPGLARTLRHTGDLSGDAIAQQAEWPECWGLEKKIPAYIHSASPCFKVPVYKIWPRLLFLIWIKSCCNTLKV